MRNKNSYQPKYKNPFDDLMYQADEMTRRATSENEKLAHLRIRKVIWESKYGALETVFKDGQ